MTNRKTILCNIVDNVYATHVNTLTDRYTHVHTYIHTYTHTHKCMLTEYAFALPLQTVRYSPVEIGQTLTTNPLDSETTWTPVHTPLPQ